MSQRRRRYLSYRDRARRDVYNVSMAPIGRERRPHVICAGNGGKPQSSSEGNDQRPSIFLKHAEAGSSGGVLQFFARDWFGCADWLCRCPAAKVLWIYRVRCGLENRQSSFPDGHSAPLSRVLTIRLILRLMRMGRKAPALPVRSSQRPSSNLPRMQALRVHCFQHLDLGAPVPMAETIVHPVRCSQCPSSALKLRPASLNHRFG